MKTAANEEATWYVRTEFGVHSILERDWCVLYTRTSLKDTLHREGTGKQQQGEKLGIEELLEFDGENRGRYNPLLLNEC